MRAGRLTPARTISEAKVCRKRCGLAILTPVVLAMMAKQGAQTGGCHPGAASAAFERNEQSAGRGGGPFQPQIVIQQLNRFRSQRQEAGLITLAAHADLRFRQQQIVAIQSPALPGSAVLATASIRRWPSRARCGNWTRIAPPHPPTAGYGAFGVFTRNRLKAGRGLPMPIGARRQ